MNDSPEALEGNWRRSLPWLVAMAAPLVVLGVMIWQRRWTSDDGFINLRVIENLLAGAGPVFNAGERIEAYTSTLWVGIVAVLGGLGVRLEIAAMVAGGALSVVGLGFAQWGALVLAGRAREGLGGIWRAAPLPLGALIYAVLPPAWDFGTSGLETGLAIGWLGFAFYRVARVVDHPRERPARVPYGTMALLGLGPLVRPELALFSLGMMLPVIGATLRARGWPSVKASALLVVKMGAAMGAIPVAYQIFRMGYFAAIVPNTAIAKSAFGSRWEQGMHYAENFFGLYMLALPLLVALGFWMRRVVTTAQEREVLRLMAIVIPTFVGLFHCVYVIKVGGGFMHGRLFLPALFGLLLPVAAVPLRGARLPASGRSSGAGVWVGAVGVVLVAGWAAYCGTSLRVAVENVHGIGDERGWYARLAKHENPVLLEEYEAMYFIKESKQALSFAERRCPSGQWHEDGAPAGCTPFVYVQKKHGELWPYAPAYTLREDLAARGFKMAQMRISIGMTSLWLGRDVYVVDRVGLANPISARLKLTKRGRPGHEKMLSNSWYVARFSAPTPGEDASVAAARRALNCGELAELEEAVRGELSMERFFSNIAAAARLHRLKIDPDPWRAAQDFCGEPALFEALAGGRGGDPARWQCPQGQALGGYQVRLSEDGASVAAIRPRCAREGQPGPGRVQGPTFGGEGGAWKPLACEPGERLVGVHAGVDRWLRSVGVVCEAGGTRRQAPRVGEGGELVEARCPDGAQAVGMVARTGALVDALGVVCRAPQDDADGVVRDSR
ncbi:hypothetical protein EA187_18485 [Lujinxingia sediminis]|uniref:Terminal beta-(1->2)-arabinofuranosyltransferase C-terminal domain-containing protein n=1 Tax=Lujinxingia sediminis TaxID=2480984 RepID=A0ABY0CNN5_9DELT|nr:hypothetical protein [Lujinxingia sediminis]RVU41462.1 hypothetical protein EA187_18485 [Lujinxingia sediminis]